jgi:guanylate kinase
MHIPIKTIVVTGPSSSGKTFLAKILLEKIPQLSLVVSYTTRERRKEDINYNCISHQEFRLAKANGEFSDWNEVYKDTFYGTKWESLANIKNENKIPLLVTDASGAKNYNEITDCLVINLIPKDLEIVKQRILSQRPDRVEERLKTLDNLHLDFGKGYEFITVDEVLDEIILDIQKHINENKSY